MIKVSVIVLAANQTNLSQRCLESLLKQTMNPLDYEIFIVGSIASEILNQYRKDYSSHSIQIVYAPRDQMVRGLNQAVADADGQYCLFIDARVIASKFLVSEHVKMQQTKAGVVGLGVPQVPLDIESKDVWGRFLKSQEGQIRAVPWLDCRLENLSIPRQKVLEAGGFCPELLRAYIIELVYRLEQHGLAVVKIDSAVVTVEKLPSLQALLQEEEERGAAYVELWRKHPQLLSRLLGNFYDTSLRGVLLRRFLLGLKASPYWMKMIGHMMPNPYLREKWDVYLQQYCFWRGVHETIANSKIWKQLTYGVPILMYHAFCANDEHPSRYIHSIRRLKVQLRLLKWLGYRIISLEEYLEYLVEDSLPPARSVIITMDDGYLDNYLVAFPVLAQLYVPVTIFLVSRYLGKVNNWDEGSLLAGRSLLGAAQAREMQHLLITFGAHSRTHRFLRTIPAEQADEEIISSKKDLEQELGLSVRLFSYPHGDYDSHTIKLVEEAGYLGACTTQTGLNTPGSSRLALYRTEIYGTFSIFRFLAALWSGK